MQTALHPSNLMHPAGSFDRLRTNGKGFRCPFVVTPMRSEQTPFLGGKGHRLL
jgi:hypothetical protein